MDQLDELISELRKAQLGYDVAHEQGCADGCDLARINNASMEIRNAFNLVLAERDEAIRELQDAQLGITWLRNARQE